MNPFSNPFQAAIIDLDNCFSDDQWRLHLIESWRERPNDRYWKYHESCHLDRRANHHIISRLRNTHRLFVFTSRPEIVRTKTEDWLDRMDIPYVELFMRPNDNHLTSVDLKRDMLRSISPQYEIERALDDRQDILDMYKEMGIPHVQRCFIYEPEVIHP